MLPTLLTLALTAAPAPPATAAEPSSVLVLRTRQAMRVRSYQRRDHMVHIVGENGQPLVMSLDQVDLTASDEATGQVFAAAAAARAAADLERAEAEPRERERQEVRERAKKPSITTAGSKRRAGGLSVIDLPESPLAEQPAPTPAGGDRSEQWWRDRATSLKDRIARQEQELELLRLKLDAAEKHYLLLAGPSNQGGRSALAAPVFALKQRIESVEQQLTSDREADRELRVEARRAGVPPGWLR